jgi:hypothetical protein
MPPGSADVNGDVRDSRVSFRRRVKQHRTSSDVPSALSSDELSNAAAAAPPPLGNEKSGRCGGAGRRCGWPGH